MHSDLHELPLTSDHEPLFSLFPPHYKLLSLSQSHLTKFPLSSVLSLLHSKQQTPSSYLLSIEPQYLINKPYSLNFLGYSSNTQQTELFHIYSSDSIPSFSPNEQTHAKALYKFTIPEPLSCKLEITWDYPLTLLSEPGKFCKSCTVYTKGGIGTHNLLESFHKDLETVSRLRKAGKGFRSETSCKERLAKFVEIEGKIVKGRFEEGNAVGEVGRIREEKMATLCGMIPRCDFDFTDKLWEVLKYAADFQEMKEAYLEVLRGVKEKNIVAKVADKNCSRLGVHLLRLKRSGYGDEDGYRSERNCLHICEGFAEDIVDICIEIALNKLKLDFRDFLVSGNVCFSHQIEYLTEDRGDDLDEAIEKVEKLFKILQIAVLVKTAGLKVNTVHGIIVPLLEYYKKNNEFPLITHKIEETLEVPNLSQFILENWEAVQEEIEEDCVKRKKYFYADRTWYIIVSEKYECR